MGNLYPPPSLPQIKERKMARFGFCAALSVIWGGWGFDVPFYSVQDINKNVQDCNLGQNRWEIYTPPPPPIPPNEGWENGAFWLLRAFILESLIGGGDGGLLFHFILSKIAILDKIDGKFVPPSTHIKDGKMARFGFCAASSLIFFLGGGGGGL